MKMRWLVGVAVMSLALAGVAQALDTVKTTKAPVPGRVVSVTAVTVELEQGMNKPPREIPVNQIQTILYDREPPDLRAAKNHVLAGRYAEALAAIERIKTEGNRPEIEQDIEFYRARLCRQTRPGRWRKDFRGRAADEGLRRRQQQELPLLRGLGDRRRPVGGRPSVCHGRGVLRPARQGPLARLQDAGGSGRRASTAGPRKSRRGPSGLRQGDRHRRRRRVGPGAAHAWPAWERPAHLLAAKKTEAAIKLATEVLKATDAEDVPLLAQGYNVLGTAYRQAGRTEEALLAFLHVDVLYASLPDAHAEALANLAELWEQVHKTERANHARKVLEEQYPDSPWAKKAGP